jgi:hypothetical protein
MTLLESLGEGVLVQVHGCPCDVLIHADCVTAVSAHIESSGNDWRIPLHYLISLERATVTESRGGVYGCL